MKSEAEIRLLRSIQLSNQDLAEINGLIKELYPDAAEITLTQLRAVLRNSQMFVAVQNEKIIGMATLVVYRKLTGVVGLVEEVVINRLFQHMGIGRKLMERLIVDAKTRHVKHLTLTSRDDRTAAHALYRSLGFTIKDTNVFRLLLT